MTDGAVKRTFIRGLAALLPTVLTVIVFVKVYEFIANNIGGPINFFIAWIWARHIDSTVEAVKDDMHEFVGTLLALAIIFIVAIFVGLFLASLVGRKAWGYLERRLFSFPVVRLVYPSVKQITDFIFGEPRVAFKRVCLVEYPRKGVFTVCFVTGKAFDSLCERTGKEMVSIFIPSSPAPFTGYTIQVYREDIIELDISVNAAMRYTISGGVIVPVMEGGAPEDIAALEKRMREYQLGQAREDQHQKE